MARSVCVCVCVFLLGIVCARLDPWSARPSKLAMSVRHHTKVLADGEG